VRGRQRGRSLVVKLLPSKQVSSVRFRPPAPAFRPGRGRAQRRLLGGGNPRPLPPGPPSDGPGLPRRGQDATCNRLDLLAVPTPPHVRAAGCTLRPDPFASAALLALRTVANCSPTVAPRPPRKQVRPPPSVPRRATSYRLPTGRYTLLTTHYSLVASRSSLLLAPALLFGYKNACAGAAPGRELPRLAFPAGRPCPNHPHRLITRRPPCPCPRGPAPRGRPGSPP
jgi:hypothetical protein